MYFTNSAHSLLKQHVKFEKLIFTMIFNFYFKQSHVIITLEYLDKYYYYNKENLFIINEHIEYEIKTVQ